MFDSVNFTLAQESELISEDLLSIFVILNQVVISTFLGVIGTVLTILNITVFVSLGFTDTTNISLLGLAVSDIGVLLTTLALSVSYNPLMVQAAPIETIDAVNYVVLGTTHVLCCRISGCLTAFITIERFVCVVFPLRVKYIFTTKRTTLAVVSIYVILVSCTLSDFLANQIGSMFNQRSNVTVTGIVLSTHADQLETFTLIVDIVAQVASFVVVVVSTLGLVRSLVRVSKWRSSTSSSSQSLQVSGRDKQLVILVLLISTVFIVCSLPTVLGNLVMICVKDFNIKGKNKHVFIFFCAIFFTLDAINSTKNIFIYLRMSSKFRHNFFSIFQCRVEEERIKINELTTSKRRSKNILT